MHLVVDGGALAATVVLDGAAVRILRAGEIDRITPVRRIDRVTCRGDVLLDARALLALASEGAPVGILRRDGELVAVMIPTRPQRATSLAEALEHAGAWPDCRDRIEDWRRAEASRHARALDIAPRRREIRHPWQAVEASFAGVLGLRPRSVAERVSRLARAFAELKARRVLIEAGCPIRWLGAGEHTLPDLAAVFGEAALWRLARIVARAGPGRRLRRAITEDIRRKGTFGLAGLAPHVHATAEQIAPRLHVAIEGDVRRFHVFLCEIAAVRRLDGGS